MIEWTASRYEFQDKIALRWSMGANMWMDYLICFTVNSCLLYVSWPLKTIGYTTRKYRFHRINHTDNQSTPICVCVNLHWYIDLYGIASRNDGIHGEQVWFEGMNYIGMVNRPQYVFKWNFAYDFLDVMSTLYGNASRNEGIQYGQVGFSGYQSHLGDQ